MSQKINQARRNRTRWVSGSTACSLAAPGARQNLDCVTPPKTRQETDPSSSQVCWGANIDGSLIQRGVYAMMRTLTSAISGAAAEDAARPIFVVRHAVN